MSAVTGLEALAQGAILSPFTRVARLLDGIAPGHAKVIEMTAGDPKETMPGFVIDKMAEAKHLLGTYPKIRCSDDLRGAIAAWIGRRYGLAGKIDPAREIHPINGSREGLFFAALPAVGRKRVDGRPVIILPNPFYQAYLGSTYATNSEPFFLNATDETGHLPDLDALGWEEFVWRGAPFAFHVRSHPKRAQPGLLDSHYERARALLDGEGSAAAPR